MELTFDLPPDGGTELAALLERSGVDFVREDGQFRFRFRFSSGGCTWQTVCRCQGDLVLVYGVHPAPVTDPARALALCGQLNARLTEALEAQSRIARALEYNAAVLSRWWERMAAEAQGLTLDP